MVNIFDGIISEMGSRFGALQGGSPFGGSPFGATSPFSATPLQGGSPFGNSPYGSGSPFANNPFQQAGVSPFGQVNWGYIANPMNSTTNDPFGTGRGSLGNTGDKTTSGGFTDTSDGSADASTARWRPLIEKVATRLGIQDPDVIQAIMMIESHGDPKAQSSQGAIGLMQILPQYHSWRVPNGGDPWEPENNIYAGAHFLLELYHKYGSWEKAAAGYLGGLDAQGNFTTATDANGTDGRAYAAMFAANMQKLKAAGTRTVDTGLAARIGGISAPITQDFGDTDYSDQNPYDYGADFGVGSGHHGLDIGYAAGTSLRTPVSGTVVLAGGTGYYKDERYGNAPGTGELRIRLDNGHILIMGHMGSINVQVGQRITAGQLVGRSGMANGAHLHLEYRIPDTSLSSGERAVDPRKYLR